MDPLMLSAVGVTSVLALTLVIALYRQSRPKQKDEGERFYFKCPKCKQRISYKKRQVSHRGMCGRCKQRFLFPPPGPQAKATLLNDDD